MITFLSGAFHTETFRRNRLRLGIEERKLLHTRGVKIDLIFLNLTRSHPLFIWQGNVYRHQSVTSVSDLFYTLAYRIPGKSTFPVQIKEMRGISSNDAMGDN